MCRRVDCSKCGRPTYSGCGAHVEQVLGGVAPADRCRCREAKEAKREAGTAGSGAGTERRSWFRGLFGE
jgi:hypothetical protein